MESRLLLARDDDVLIPNLVKSLSHLIANLVQQVDNRGDDSRIAANTVTSIGAFDRLDAFWRRRHLSADGIQPQRQMPESVCYILDPLQCSLAVGL